MQHTSRYAYIYIDVGKPGIINLHVCFSYLTIYCLCLCDSLIKPCFKRVVVVNKKVMKSVHNLSRNESDTELICADCV